MPTLQEFGQTIKKKYPQYQNIDDTELATKMLEKYPQYKDRVFDTDPNAQQQIAGEKPTEGVWDAIKKGGQNMVKNRTQMLNEIAETDMAAGKVNPVLRTGKYFGTVATTLAKNLIAEPIGTALRAGGEIIQSATGYDINEKLPEGVNKLVQAGLDTEAAQKVAEGYDKYVASNPESKMAAATLGDIAELLSYVIGGKAAKETTSGVSKATNTLVQTSKDTTSKIKSIIPSSTTMLKSKGESLLKSKVATKISDAITPIEPGVKTFLTKTDDALSAAKPGSKLARLDKYVSQAEAAVDDFSKPTPLELAGEKATDAVRTMNNKMKVAGELKSEVVSNLSNVKVGSIARESRSDLRKLLKDRLGSSITKQGIKSSPGRVSSLSDAADTKLLTVIDDKLKSLGSNPGFRQVDDTVDYIQDLLYKRSSNLAVPVNGKVEGIVKTITGKLNNHLKELKTGNPEIDTLVQGYKKANDTFSSIVGTRNTLNKLLGTEGNRAGALMKRVFSPSDAGTKKLFAKVKEITGIDLVDEATLAKFVMENVGDARQASLLAEAIKGNVASKRSFIVNAVNRAITKMQNPIGKARRMIINSQK